MISSEVLLSLPGHQGTDIEEHEGRVRISVRHTRPRSCPACEGTNLRFTDVRMRCPRHKNWGMRRCEMELESLNWHCLECGQCFRDRLPGIQPRKRATEPFRRSIFQRHLDGTNRSGLGRREGIGSATVERWFQDFPRLEASQRNRAQCPRVLGIDEQFCSRCQGYATTFCDLRNNTAYDVVLGRSERALEDYLTKLPGRQEIRQVCMGLSGAYQAIVKEYFPNAHIVAGRCHGIRLINRHFLASWRELDPVVSRKRGLHSLMPRHRPILKRGQLARLNQDLAQRPALALVCRLKQHLCCLMLEEHRTRNQCRRLIPRLLKVSAQLCGASPRNWALSARGSTPGRQRSPPCGGSRGTTALQRDSAPR